MLGETVPPLIGCAPFADVAFDVSTGEESFSRRICLFFWGMFFLITYLTFVLLPPTKKKSRRICKGKNNGIYFGVVKCSFKVWLRCCMVGSLLKNSLGYDGYHYVLLSWKHLTLPEIQVVAPPIVTQHVSRVLFRSGLWKNKWCHNTTGKTSKSDGKTSFHGWDLG